MRRCSGALDQVITARFYPERPTICIKPEITAHDSRHASGEYCAAVQSRLTITLLMRWSCCLGQVSKNLWGTIMSTKKILGLARNSAVAAVAGACFATAGWSSTLTVLADVNADAFDSTSNQSVYLNILGDSTSVTFSRVDEQQDGTLDFFNAQAGVTAVENAATINSALLANVDLLVISRFFRAAVDYAAAEIDAMSDFLSGGGDILVVLESDESTLDGYNALLSGLGSEIQYTGGRVVASTTDSSLEDTVISTMGDSFSVSAYNILSGGDSVASDANGGTFLAVETFANVAEVPLPATLPLLAFALGGAGFVARRKRR